jgi:hypothetical protein
MTYLKAALSLLYTASPGSAIMEHEFRLTMRMASEQGVEENIWAKEGWSDGRVEKAA